LVGIGAWALFIGTAVGTLDNAFVVAQAVRAGKSSSPQGAWQPALRS